MNRSGFVAESVNPTISAIGLILRSLAFCSFIRIKIEAPSLIGDELAAVIDPFLTNAGFNFEILSKLTLEICSSSSTITSFPFLSMYLTGIISFLNKPFLLEFIERL